MSETNLTELRKSIDYMKEQSGSGSKQRKQDEFERIYTAFVGYLVTGERYDAAGVGPATAKDAATNCFDIDPSEYSTLSEALASLGTQDGNDSTEDLVQSLDQLADLSGDEQKEYLVDILLGYSEPSIVTLALLDDESFGLGTSQMKEIWFDGTRSERKRAEALTEGTVDFITRAKNDNLPEEPEPMVPFSPMLAKPESSGEPSNLVVQPKIDGYRLLIHVLDGDARAYTRNREEVTFSLPELNKIDWPAGDYIFDCEVIAEDGTYASTSSRVGTKAENLELEQTMNFACFDLVYANGDMTRKSYEERYRKLERLVIAIDDGRVGFLEASSNIDAVREHALDAGYEGVILKDLQSEYELGTRSSNWVKSKTEAESVDVRIVDFEEGDGRLTGTLGKISIESGDGVHLGNVGTGFTDEERDEIWENRQDWMGGTIEVVAEAFDEGLRFPRFERDRRDDGEPDHIDKVEELLPKA